VIIEKENNAVPSASQLLPEDSADRIFHVYNTKTIVGWTLDKKVINVAKRFIEWNNISAVSF